MAMTNLAMIAADAGFPAHATESDSDRGDPKGAPTAGLPSVRLEDANASEVGGRTPLSAPCVRVGRPGLPSAHGCSASSRSAGQPGATTQHDAPTLPERPCHTLGCVCIACSVEPVKRFTANALPGSSFGAMRFALIAALVLAAVLPAAAPCPNGRCTIDRRQNRRQHPPIRMSTCPLRQGAALRPVRKLATVQTPSGREVVANRVLVKFAPGVSSARAGGPPGHGPRRAGRRGWPPVGRHRRSHLVDVSVAELREAAAMRTAAPTAAWSAPPRTAWRMPSARRMTPYGLAAELSLIGAPAAWNRTHGILDASPSSVQGMYMHHSRICKAKIDGAETGPATLWGFNQNDDFLVTSGASPASPPHDDRQRGRCGGYRLRRPLAQRQSPRRLGNGSAGSAADAIIWATDRNARVINLSLGGTRDCEPYWIEDSTEHRRRVLRDAIDSRSAVVVVVVAAAGDTDRSGELLGPAACPHVLAVANTTSADVKASSSTYGLGTVCGTRHLHPVHRAARWHGIPSGLVGWYRPMLGYVDGGSARQRVGRAGAGQSRTSSILGGDRPASSSLAIRIARNGTYWQTGRINAMQAVCTARNTNGLSITTVTDTSMSFIWNDRELRRRKRRRGSVRMASRWRRVANRDTASQLDQLDQLIR